MLQRPRASLPYSPFPTYATHDEPFFTHQTLLCAYLNGALSLTPTVTLILNLTLNLTLALTLNPKFNPTPNPDRQSR